MEALSPAVLTLLVLAVMAVLFVTEVIPLSITALGGAISLGLLGVIPTNVVFSGLSNPTVVLFAGMFVIGAAVFHTGLAHFLGAQVVRAFGGSEISLMVGTMGIAALLSAVSSNTATTAALMPMVVGICSVAHIPVSRQLMPLAFAAGFGGTMTLVGTPPNMIANASLKAAEIMPFGFFEFAKIGVPITLVGMVYMVFVGRRLIPASRSPKPNTPCAKGEAEAQAPEHNVSKMIITGLTLLGVVIVMTLDIKIIPLEKAAVIGAIILVLTRCISEKRAYQGIDWVTIFLFAGMMPVATALDKSGAGKMMADEVILFMGNNPSPYLLCVVLYILAAALSQFMSNTATAALLCPIGLSIAKGIGVEPHGVIMIITVAASCAFATPIGTPPNTLVLSAGGYRFMDYVKVGGPLVLLYLVVSVVLVPLIWPFYLN